MNSMYIEVKFNPSEYYIQIDHFLNRIYIEQTKHAKINRKINQ